MIRAAQATDADIFYAASYPPDSVGLVRAAHEIGYTPKVFGGSHGRAAGDQHPDAARAAAERHCRVRGVGAGARPWPFPGVFDMLKRYQAQAKGEGVDPLGYFLAPAAYAYIQLLGAGRRGGEDARPGKTRRLHPQPQILDRLRHVRIRRRTARPPTPTSARCRCSITTSSAAT